MLRREITPVITHPERNALLMGRVNELVEWVRFGCLIQVTAQSFTGRFGKKAQEGCKRLMRQNMVHFVASDAHDTEWRPPDLRGARQIVSSEYGEDSGRAPVHHSSADDINGRVYRVRRSGRR